MAVQHYLGRSSEQAYDVLHAKAPIVFMAVPPFTPPAPQGLHRQSIIHSASCQV
jgi:hypothetical protein